MTTTAQTHVHLHTDAEPFDFMLGALAARLHPLHDQHVANVRYGLSRAKYFVVLVGSANLARSYKNPLSYEERKSLIEECFPLETANGRLMIRPMPDFYRNNAGWAANTKCIVREVAASVGRIEGVEVTDGMIGLAGFRKDAATSEYLDMFPEWGDIMITERTSDIDATKIREAYFHPESRILSEHLPTPVSQFLEDFRHTRAFELLVRERLNIDHIAEVYNKGNPENHTGDLLIRHRSKSLLIRRNGDYGHDLWAFPGGIRDPGEDSLECSLREVDEETGLTKLNPHLSIDMLKSNVKLVLYNDTKGRDLRGTYITTLFVIDLPSELPEPIVEPLDDAKFVAFVDHDLIEPTAFFADHGLMLHEAMRQLASL